HAAGLSSGRSPREGCVPAYLLVIGGMAMIGLMFLIFVYLPLRRQSVLTIVIGTVGVGIFIQNVMLLIWGPLPKRVPSPMGGGAVTLGEVTLSMHVLYVIVVTAI